MSNPSIATMTENRSLLNTRDEKLISMMAESPVDAASTYDLRNHRERHGANVFTMFDLSEPQSDRHQILAVVRFLDA